MTTAVPPPNEVLVPFAEENTEGEKEMGIDADEADEGDMKEEDLALASADRRSA